MDAVVVVVAVMVAAALLAPTTSSSTGSSFPMMTVPMREMHEMMLLLLLLLMRHYFIDSPFQVTPSTSSLLSSRQHTYTHSLHSFHNTKPKPNEKSKKDALIVFHGNSKSFRSFSLSPFSLIQYNIKTCLRFNSLTPLSTTQPLLLAPRLQSNTTVQQQALFRPLRKCNGVVGLSFPFLCSFFPRRVLVTSSSR